MGVFVGLPVYVIVQMFGHASVTCNTIVNDMNGKSASQSDHVKFIQNINTSCAKHLGLHWLFSAPLKQNISDLQKKQLKFIRIKKKLSI